MDARNPDMETKLFTPANIVTLTRICLVPVFVIVLLAPWPEWLVMGWVINPLKSLIAAIVFILISCTDWVDGYLARSRGEVTDFGKFMDPLADKILVAAALLALVELGVLPSWPVLIILTREFIVSGLRMMAATKGEVIAASWYGKAKTVFQIVAIVLFLLKDAVAHLEFILSSEAGVLPGATGIVLGTPFYNLAWAVMAVALVLTIVSMLDYLSKSRSVLGFGERKGSAAPVHVECEEEPAAEAELSIEGLSRRIVDAATETGLTVACAESLTGGLLAGAVTAVPGSSAVLRGGVVSYTDEVKRRVLGVSEEILESDGAVSARCACAMAKGARTSLGSDIAVSVTGIAGPGGAEPGKPVGTVFIGCSTANMTSAKRFDFEGDRESVRMQTVAQALAVIYEEVRAHSQQRGA